MLTRRALTVAAALAGVLLVVVGGSLLTPQRAAFEPSRIPLVGRTTTVCTAVESADGSASTTVSAVVVRQAPGRTGTLGVSRLGSEQAELTITDQGKGGRISGATKPVVLAGEGVMATASSGAVLAVGASGADAGLMAAPCLAPASTLWFTGLGAGDADRTELVLTNPDDSQAEVDLRFYGSRGRVVVPGSPGLVIDARSSRSLSLTSLVRSAGALGVAIEASEGRVSAVAKRILTDQLRPAGVDWQLPSVAPADAVVIPAVPGGDGGRELVVTNPGPVRATVQVEVLGLQGAYAPSGAESLEIAAESSAAVELAPGLAGSAASVRVRGDQPVTAAVISTSVRNSAEADLAIQSAAAPLVRTGVSALATISGADSELVLSNASDVDTPVSFEVLSYDGVSLRSDDVLLGPGSTATRRLSSPAPSYLVVKVPDGSSVVGGVVLTQPQGDVAGLATVPLTSPDVASRAPRTIADPAVGR